MLEEEVLVEEDEDIESSDEELWSQEDEVEGDSTKEGTPEVEDEEAEAEEPELEDDETEDEEEPEEPQHDYEARYRDLEREFHRRNEDSARLRQDFDELRLRDVEREQALTRVKQGLSETEAPPVDPSSDTYFDDSDRQTMEEFSELSSTFRKMIQHEMAKAGTTMQEATIQAQQRLTNLEDQTKEQNYQNFLHYHENYMNENVGDDYRDIDKDADFQAFVLGSPAMTKMMTESTDPVDHASVMQLFLSTQVGEDAWRPPEEVKPVKASTRRQAKRAAATGLLGNSAPVKSKNLDNLSDDELWEAIPE
jgi:ElaB/YqjD/DUF883 family membrane-anchored ribosome-binding protein|tara:strand:+ start:171 stop:1094 length:924 start_codon:yes stop_codon:yes gene_type:complete